jgi:hypothetical protein
VTVPADAKPPNPVLTVVITTAAVMVPILLASVLLGFYVADAYGYSRTVVGVAFSAIGLLVSLVIVVRLAGRIAKSTQARL